MITSSPLNRAWYAAEAFIALIVLSMSLRTLGLTRLLQRLSSRFQPSVITPSASRARLIEFDRAYRAVRNIWPVSIECLHRSLVLFFMARRRGLQAQLIIGVRKYPFTSHAWIDCDGPLLEDEQQLISTLISVYVID